MIIYILRCHNLGRYKINIIPSKLYIKINSLHLITGYIIDYDTPVSTEVEVEALDLPHSCPECERTFPTSRGLAVHRARWCRPGQRPASRRGQLVDKAVKLAKRKASAALLLYSLHLITGYIIHDTSRY